MATDARSWTDADALVEAAHATHADAVRRRLRRMVRDDDEAEDLLQEAFLRLTVAARQGRVPDHTGFWLSRVATNLAISRARRRAVARRYIDAWQPDPGRSDETLVDHVLDPRLGTALRRLRPASRVALVMASDGYGSAEIARRIGRSELATRSLLCRARGRLRRELAGVADPDRGGPSESTAA
jgi:RNA polymerase sigma-70 factor (ECF subfamily)